MIISSFFCYLTILSLFGYSYLFKKIENVNKKIIVSNDDFFYGILIIIFFSLFINLFFPLKYFTIIIFTIGLILFGIGYKNKIYKIKFLFYLYIILIINFFSFYNGPNVDSPMYHLQTLNWMILHKINFGIINLNIRFGVNSSWHSFLALMNITFQNLSLKYYLSSIIFSILSYAIFFKKKYFVSDIFLFLSISFLLTFSFIHPFVNGPILNHLGNPEVDTVAMFLFIFCFYYFLKFYENSLTINNTSINLMVLIIFLAITIKISNISLIFLLLVILIFNRNYKLINFSNIFIGLTSLLWMTRSFIVSGCLIFPIKKTCLETQWTDLEQTELIANVIQSYTRDTRLRLKWTDYDYTLYSNDWFIPWFKDYFLNTALLKISSIVFLATLIILISLFVIERYQRIEKKKSEARFFIIVGLFFFIAIYMWLKAPEIRFGSGMIISLPCFLIAILFNKLRLNKYFTHRNTLFVVFGLFFLIIGKHFNKFELNHLVLINKGNANYEENITKITEINGVEIFHSTNSQCGDYPKICVNNKRENYKIVQKFNYRVFANDNH